MGFRLTFIKGAAQKLSLQEPQADVFFYAMSPCGLWKNQIIQRYDIKLFSMMLNCLLQKMHFQYNEWIKQNETLFILLIG